MLPTSQLAGFGCQLGLFDGCEHFALGCQQLSPEDKLDILHMLRVKPNLNAPLQNGFRLAPAVSDLEHTTRGDSIHDGSRSVRPSGLR